MLADADNVPVFDPPDPELTYVRDLETCRRAGVKPVPRDSAQGLVREWSDLVAGRPESTALTNPVHFRSHGY